MESSFSWQNFDRMAHVLESLGYLVLIFGPLVGLGMMIFGSGMINVMGLVVMVGSILIALYHICFSLMMRAIRGLIHDHTEVVETK